MLEAFPLVLLKLSCSCSFYSKRLSQQHYSHLNHVLIGWRLVYHTMQEHLAYHYMQPNVSNIFSLNRLSQTNQQYFLPVWPNDQHCQHQLPLFILTSSLCLSSNTCQQHLGVYDPFYFSYLKQDLLFLRLISRVECMVNYEYTYDEEQYYLMNQSDLRFDP